MPGTKGRRRDDRGATPRVPRWPQWALMALALALFLLPGIVDRSAAARRIPYSAFVQLLDSGRISRVEVGDSYLRGQLKSPAAGGGSEVVTNRVDAAVADELRKHGIEFSGKPRNGVFDTVLGWVLPLMVLLPLWWFLTRRLIGQQASGPLGIGRSSAKVYVEQDTKVAFDDVAGVDEAKAELREVVSFLRDPESFGRLGARVPKGVLLVGPPGTGKTLLARAVAGEASVPFISINGSEFVELYVGVGAARVRDLFERARQTAPCIIFIDEIDALGRARGAGSLSGANDEKEQTLNQLLAELDGFSPEGGVILLAATNRPEILDTALLRAGRFDRQILVDRPDRTGRLQILAVHVKKISLAAELQLEQVAALTPGFTGADIANLVNEAALAATRRGGEAVTMEDFTVAVERIVAGLAKKSRVLSPREREITAYHEMGHAIVALATPGADPVQKVSIIPHGLGSLGFTLQRPADERYIETQGALEGKLTVLLGGRAAELSVFGELSTGAADDLVRATALAREMVMRFGMDATVGHVVYRDQPGLVPEEAAPVSAQTSREIEVAVRTLLQQALERATAVLSLNRSGLDRGAHLLVERETLTREELPRVTAVAQPRAQPRARTQPA
jgi:cell division protease FtsH